MKYPKLHAQIITGVVLAALLSPGAALSIPVVVTADTSPTSVATMVNSTRSLAEDIRRNVLEASRWLETKAQYVRDIEEQVKRYTKLAGILDKAQEMIEHKDSIIKAMTEIGGAVRSIILLKNQIEWMVVRQVTSIRQIYQRLKSGVFDERANLRDLEGYLKEIIGTGWDQRYETWQMGMERLAMGDTELMRWHDELRQVQKSIVDEQAQLKAVDEAIKRETDKPQKDRSELNVQTLVAQQEAIQARIKDLEARADELLDKIKERCRYYNVQMKDMWGFGAMVETEQENWSEFLSVNERALGELDDYAARPRVVHPAGEPVSPSDDVLPPAFGR